MSINSVSSTNPASVFLNKPQTPPTSQREATESPAVEASESQAKQAQEGEATQAQKPTTSRLDIYA